MTDEVWITSSSVAKGMTDEVWITSSSVAKGMTDEVWITSSSVAKGMTDEVWWLSDLNWRQEVVDKHTDIIYRRLPLPSLRFTSTTRTNAED